MMDQKFAIVLDTCDLHDEEFQGYLRRSGIDFEVRGSQPGADEVEYSGTYLALVRMFMRFFRSCAWEDDGARLAEIRWLGGGLVPSSAVGLREEEDRKSVV